MYTFIKVFVSAIVIGVITEIARRYPAQGGVIAALPLVTILSIIWLFVQGESQGALSTFLLGVLKGLPATIVLVFIVYIAMQNSIHLIIALFFGIGGWALFLFVQTNVIKYISSLVSH
ncbi:DUF3147 family protein [Priestia taiwanensis]|uniref:DUF3147 family protein n=1 Tax=Priestia taiwanensis TaxID=1347902 RepID=A0A917APB7_9BACI|nr:DUF3147 family protein [Priestia taiwanensis]MBM7362629.1 hypothetical protein [Priestia taiwanensis]GGE63795.1 hypothetical protein GCM10007140_12540 [Priestia taiwanensis]